MAGQRAPAGHDPRRDIPPLARCTDNGGHFEYVNCQEVEQQNCTTIDMGNNMVSTAACR
jgi:hypothetical protein